jgi:aldehyde:ferredoxin oxidoreductase
LTKKYLVKNSACWACPIGCTRISKTDKVEGEGPEYETTWAFGAECGIDDLPAMIEANHLCNDLGLDTISVGSTIACAMELAGIGLLACDLRFGRADLLAKTVEDIGYRRDVGAELADGSLRLAKKYGRPDLSMSSKGLEMPAHDLHTDARRSVLLVVHAGRSVPDHADSQADQRAVHRVPQDERRL